MQRVSAGHYQVAAHGFQYDVIKKDIPVVNWIILKNSERFGPHSIGRYGKAKELVYADIEKEEAEKGENVTDPNMAIQHLDTTGTDRPTGNASGPANTPLEHLETANPEPDMGNQATMGEEESVEIVDDEDDDPYLTSDVDDDPEKEDDDSGESEEDEAPVD